jgi:hypothetical protein
MKTYYQIIACTLLAALVGCRSPKTVSLVPDSSIEYSWKTNVEHRLQSISKDVQELQEFQYSFDELSSKFAGRKVPAKVPKITPASYSVPAPAQDLESIIQGSRPVQTVQVKQPEKVVQVQTPAPVQEPVVEQPIVQQPVQSVVQQPIVQQPIVQTVQSQPVQSYQSAPMGPKTFGSTRYAGVKEEITYQTRQKVVTERVPVKRQVPVMKQDVYQTVQEQYPVQVSKTRMRTEQRTRSVNKTVMTQESRTRKVPKTIYVDETYSVSVPKTVTEQQQYSVQVPETYQETVMQTRSKRVKVGERDVVAPVASVAECVPCQQTQAVQYSAPAPVQYAEPAPTIEYAAAPACPPSYSTAPVQYQQIVESAPAPVQAVMNFARPVAQPIFQAAQPIFAAAQPMFSSVPACPPQFASAAPAARRQPVRNLMASRPAPVASFSSRPAPVRSPLIRRPATAPVMQNSYSSPQSSNCRICVDGTCTMR